MKSSNNCDFVQVPDDELFRMWTALALPARVEEAVRDCLGSVDTHEGHFLDRLRADRAELASDIAAMGETVAVSAALGAVVAPAGQRVGSCTGGWGLGELSAASLVASSSVSTPCAPQAWNNVSNEKACDEHLARALSQLEAMKRLAERAEDINKQVGGQPSRGWSCRRIPLR